MDNKEKEVLEINSQDSIDKQLDLQADIGFDEDVDQFINPDQVWWKEKHLLMLNLGILLVTLSSSNNGYDGSILNGLQSLDIWKQDLGEANTRGQMLGALSNAMIFGSILGTPLAPYISDRYGRKMGIVVGQSIGLVGAILQGTAKNYAWFLGARLVIGFGAIIAFISSPSLVAEIAFPTHRSRATGFYNTCWYLGAVIAAWITYGTRNINNSYCWRIPSYLQGLMNVIQLGFIWLIPESPRFYVSRGKIDKARDFLNKYHVGNKTDERSLGLVDFELKQIEVAIEMERLASNSSYWDFIKIKSFHRRLFLICYIPCLMQLSGNGLVSYYLNLVLNSIGITDSSEQLMINACLMIYNMVVSMALSMLFGYFKRKTLFLASSSLMCLFYVLWTALSAINEQKGFPGSYGKAVLAMIFLYYFSYDIGMNGLPILYATEILPFSHRAKGLNIFQIVEKVVLIYNGYVNPIAMEAIGWKYYIVYCVFLFTEVFVIYFFFVETSSYTLEEVSKVFGDDPRDLMMNLSEPVEKPNVEHKESV
ncbi:high-affinity glucose transporter Hxt2p [[Candida] jaroonii]|uniref:High-affinity glucose transporter Hxt2p n=1 Tax=[Candida] jaroonii TaxID=467808 RepID=A0ACA9Y8K7_9ASCO|nr:high-affinity glucose transporter Hxt2p [[Candida] jaroonii]